MANLWLRSHRAIVLFFAMVFISACSSNAGDESTGSESAAVVPAYCSTFTMTNLHFSAGTHTVTNGPFTGYLPATLPVSIGTTSGVTAQLVIKVVKLPGFVTCTYNYPATNSTTYGNPSCTGTSPCGTAECPTNPINHHFVSPAINPSIQFNMSGTGVVQASATIVDNPSDDGNPCTTDNCVGSSATHTALTPGSSCSDGNYCNGMETCNASAVCTSGAVLPAGAVIPGDTNICDGVTTCNGSGGTTAGTNAPNGTPCLDSNVCDGQNACDGAGHCSSITTIPALATDTCHTAGCDTNNGLSPTYNTATCPGPGTSSAILGSSPSTVGANDGFIYATQTGATATIDPLQAGVIRGQVFDTTGAVKSGVTVSLLGHSEYGTVTTQSDGWFDMEVNAGGEYVVQYTDPAGTLCGGNPCLTVQRHALTRWNQYTIVSDAVMTAKGTATAITANAAGYQYAQQAAASTDGDGSRYATVIFPPGTTSAGLSGFSTWHVAPTEFTVGALGAKAMPGELPPASGYTYAVDLDIAEANGATVTFSNSVGNNVYFYIEQISHIPAFGNGTAVPMGYYDRTTGEWIASGNGQVITFTASTSACNDGSGSCPGIPAAELAALHNAYNPIHGSTPTQYWRIPVTHFTAYDANWGFGPSTSDRFPPSSPPNNAGGTPDGCQGSANPDQSTPGSLIECESQSLDETIPVADTPFFLTYASRRSRYSNNRVEIPITDGAGFGSSPPSEIDVVIQIAGRRETFTTTATTANQTIVWNWDRKDAYGRFLQGAQHASIEVDYVYPGTFGATASFGAYPTGSGISGSRLARTINLYRNYDVVVGGVDQDLLGFGGWTLSPAHVFDIGSGYLERGDGQLQLDRNVGAVKTVAGDRSISNAVPTDGSSALSASLWPLGVAVGHDGSIYIASIAASTHGALYQVLPSGAIYTIAGIYTGSGMTFANGDPAVGAAISVNGIAVDRDDSVLVQDARAGRIVRISPPANPLIPTGRTVSLVAGSLAGSTAGVLTDGAIASATLGNTPGKIAIARDGTIYFSDVGSNVGDTWRIRRITGGTTAAEAIETVVGGGATVYDGSAVILGSASHLNSALAGLAIDSAGSVYFTISGDLMGKLAPDGNLFKVAGNNVSGVTGDGGQATAAEINNPSDIAIDSHDRIYFGDYTDCTIRTIGVDGVISRFGGTISSGTNCLPSTDPILDGAAPQATRIAGPFFLAMGPDDSLTFAGGVNEVVRSVAGLGGEFIIPDARGGVAYSFSNGLHVETKSGLTGTGLYYFCYDSNQLLSKVIDETCAGAMTIADCPNSHPGCETTVTSRTSTNVTIQSPFGKNTTLTLSGGMATMAQDPTSVSYNLGYSATLTDLLTSFADPSNVALSKHHALAYSADGLLTQDQDPITQAASWTGTSLARKWMLDGWYVDFTTPEGFRKSDGTLSATALSRTRHLVIDRSPSTSFPERSEQRTTVRADGTKYTEDWNNDQSRHQTLADATTVDTAFSADPRLGWGARYVSLATTTSSLGSRIRKEYRTATLTNPTDPFSATTETDKIEINPTNTTDPTAFDTGNFATRSVTFGSSPTVTYSSPVGRTVTETLDSFGRPTQIHVPNGGGCGCTLADVNIYYDSLGRVDHVDQGTSARTHQNVYYSSGGNNGLLHTVTDSIDGFTSYDSYDADDRLTQETTPGALVDYEGYDVTGNLNTVRTPRSSSSSDATYLHTLSHNDDNLLSLYDPPLALSPKDTSYGYDLDRLLTSEATPDDTIANSYDGAGRWNGRGGAAPAYRTYLANGKVGAETANGLTYTYTYTGNRLTSIATSGLYAKTITYAYDTALRVASRKIDSASPDSVGYDADELMTSFGAMTSINRDTTNGLLLGTTVNSVSDSYVGTAYNSYGEMIEYDAGSSGGIYKEVLTRDTTLGGRILSKTETVNGGTAIVHNYGYDSANRLQTDNASTYTYDNDGNRTDFAGVTYDAQDRIVKSGVSYSNDGRMTNDTTFTYTYDALGNLLTSSAAGGTTYTVDSQNRRVKKVTASPAATQQFLYGTGPYPIAELDSAGALKWTFYYGTGRNVPDYAVYNGTTSGTMVNSHVYRLFADQLGSVRVVYDTNASSIVQTMEYDAWGNVTTDTSPGYQPFGFAGGLYDKDTGLMRFGARDYNPRVARWMTKDAARFAGGLNLYAYVHDDPVNFKDRSGRTGEEAIPLIGGGFGDWSTAWAVFSGGSSTIIPLVLLGAPVGGAIVGGGFFVSEGNDDPTADDEGATEGGVCDEGDAGTDEPSEEECKEQWDDAYQRCRDLLENPTKPNGGRANRRLRGGHINLTDCAKGFVSEACGGNALPEAGK